PLRIMAAETVADVHGAASGRATRLAVIALALVPLAFLAAPIFRGEALVPAGMLYTDVPPWRGSLPEGVPACEYPLGDQVAQFYPWGTLTDEALGHGRLPLWNPYSSFGSPLLANGQSAPLFPLRLVSLAFDARAASWLSAIARLSLALFGTYALA